MRKITSEEMISIRTESQKESMNRMRIDLKHFIKTYTDGSGMVKGENYEMERFLSENGSIIVRVKILTGYKKELDFIFGKRGKIETR